MLMIVGLAYAKPLFQNYSIAIITINSLKNLSHRILQSLINIFLNILYIF